MAGPTIAFNNLLLGGDGIVKSSTGTFTQEMAYPRDNILSGFATKPWRSKYQTFTINAQNNQLDFNITAAGLALNDKTAVLTSAEYRGEELATEIASKMNTAAGVTDISCVYNRSSRSFTISKASGDLWLKWATGANKSNSVAATLQYLTVADLSGSLSYIGENDAFTTGGWYVITSSNNKLYFNIGGGTLTATIPVGTYTAKGLAAEIKYQMDVAAGGGITNFHANHYPSILTNTHRWKLQRGSGTFQLETSNTTNAIWATLGYTTGSNKTGALFYIAEQRRIHTEDSPGPIDLGAATNLTFVSIVGLNLAAAETGGTFSLLLQGNSADIWSSPTYSAAPDVQVLNQSTQKGFAFWILNSTQRYWRIKIINNDNSDGYVQIGAMFGGVSTTLQTNYIWGAVQTRRVFTDRQITDQGTVYGTIKNNQFEARLQFQKIAQLDKNVLDALVDTVADVHPFAILLDTTGSSAPRFVWANLVSPPEFIESTIDPNGSIWRCDNFTIRESG